jgi:hypothetical protein
LEGGHAAQVAISGLFGEGFSMLIDIRGQYSKGLLFEWGHIDLAANS